MNWPVIILIGIGAVALIAFLVVRNLKDKKKFEDQLNNDYHKTKDEEGDIDVEKAMK